MCWPRAHQKKQGEYQYANEKDFQRGGGMGIALGASRHPFGDGLPPSLPLASRRPFLNPSVSFLLDESRLSQPRATEMKKCSAL